jgi:2,3-bisphosphoglycerate-independent phosphoglycerate mutase
VEYVRAESPAFSRAPFVADDLLLTPNPRFRGRPGPLLVVVMDGIGCRPPDDGNAVELARKPTLDRLRREHPWIELRAHGTAVGLPSDDDMGNSEVGHNAMGAGRVFDQGSKLVSAAIASGRIWSGETWRAIVARLTGNGQPLHLIGLLSDGNVHSHVDHLEALIRRAASEGIRQVYVHALLDGRDVPETSALVYVERLEKILADHDGQDGRRYRIASGGGRMKVTMDRYGADWSVVELGWKTHVRGEGRRFASARDAVETLRDENPGVIDQDLPAFVIAEKGEPVAPIRDGAAVIFFNFRGDRAIEMSRAFEDQGFPYFDREPRPDILYAGMMEYDGDTHVPSHYLVEPPAIERTMGEMLAHAGVAQFACSETQKFGHVTYFWNGNRSGAFDPKSETYVEVPSDRLPFEERPWMKAAEIADATIDALSTGKHRFARINFANGDMVGHTGVLDSTVLAVEAVDLSLARLLRAVEKLGGIVLVTADHGNADDMFERDKQGNPKVNARTRRPAARTSHTLAPVPFTIYDPGFAGEYRIDPSATPRGLSNVAATCLALLGYRKPEGYDPPLIRFGE